MTRQFILFGLFFLISLSIIELFIRNSFVVNTSSTEFYDDIGRGRRKNLTYLYFNEGFSIGRFNNQGFIGSDLSSKKGENSFRVALLGDSYVESFQVFERDYFGSLAENQLNSRLDNSKFKFLNFGRSGFDLSNIYCYYKTFAENYNPDVSLFFISTSDLIPSYKDPLLPRAIIENNKVKISFEYPEEELIKFEKLKFLIQYSALLNMLNNCRKKTHSIPISSIIFGKFYPIFSNEPSQVRSNKNDNNDYIHPLSIEILKAIDPNEVIIVNKGGLPEKYENLIHEKGFYYIDLNNFLDSIKINDYDPNEWEVTGKRGHWNTKAHTAISKKLSDEIVLFLEGKRGINE